MSRSQHVKQLLWAMALVLGIGLVAAPASNGEVPSYDRVRALETPRSIGDATLTDHNGAAFDLSDLNGNVAFVLFGFTNCPDACPLSMDRLRQLHESGQLTGESVVYVMISVDGERDTPEAMKAFLAKYSQDFVGLTAEPARVNPIAEQFAATFFKGSPTGHGDYNVMHSPQIFVLDTAGRLRAELYGASLEAMTGVARALLAEKSAAQ